MRIVIPRMMAFAVVVGSCFASSMFAQGNNCTDPTVPCFGIVGPGPTNNNLAGVYTDPYQAVGANSALAFCDDYFDEVDPPESWNALVTNLNVLSPSSDATSVYYTGGTLLDNNAYSQQTLYIAAAILAAESLNTSSVAQQNQLSFALWGIFDPDVLSNSGPLGSDSTDLTAAKGYLYGGNGIDINGVTGALGLAALAESAATSSVSAGQVVENFLGGCGVTSADCLTAATVNIYTPTINGTSPQLPGQTVGNEISRPQEFITVSVPSPGNVMSMPETSSWPALLIDLSGVAVAGFFFRRRQMRSNA